MKKEQVFQAGLLLFAMALLGTAQDDSCKSDSFPSTGQFLVEDNVNYLVPNATVSVGHLVIVPGMRFNCHGYITSWSGLVQFASNNEAINHLDHDITFQVWRPSAENSGIYTFVGSQIIDFISLSLRENLVVIDDVQYINFTSPQPRESGERLVFQPGDVVGWYIHTLFRTTQVPLTVVYGSSSDSSGSNPVDMYTTMITDTAKADTPPPCELSFCSDQFTLIPSVIPYVTVDYESLSSPPEMNSDPMCLNVSLEACHVTSSPGATDTISTIPITTVTPFSSSSSPPTTVTSGSIFTLPVIAGLATGLVLIIATTIFIIIVCLCAKSRSCVLGTPLKHRRSSFHDNPTYTSPDDFVRVDSPPTPANAIFEPIQHYHAGNGALYALPESNTPLTSSTTQLDPDNIFDGECYASTYQTNGQCHVYQELAETRNEKRGFSQSTLHITKQELPELPTGNRNRHPSLKSGMSVPRFSFSVSTNTLPAHFPYTLPNTPAPSHPYLEAIDSRPLQLPQTPDDTPPQSAGAIPHVNGAPVRKLFHSIDDEGYHVPTHELRMQFLTDASTEELYSRLNRPHAKCRDSREVNFFEQADLYWEPPSSTAELYNQLAMRKYREIHRDQVHVLAVLGSGHFGAVSRGFWEVPGGRVDVAIKFLKPGSSEEDKASFLQEAAIMGQFLHPNIVKLHGVVTVGEPLMIVLELMPNGDLKNYLRDLKNKVPNLPLDLPELFLNFCRQIGFGMNYLSNKAFIHRDLAARNILLTQDLTCKIGDFGMTRALSSDDTYQSQGGKIPLKWTAPEALNYRRFTSASDVWSYGIVLFEIWSLGQQPFRRVSDANELMSLVNSGHCQAPPPGCPRAIYELMVKCWHPIHEGRPRFSEICDYLSADDETLLYWSHEDRIVSPSVTHLGAPLSEARNLYPDLQFSYDNNTVV